MEKGMTVGDLLKELEKLDPDKPVGISISIAECRLTQQLHSISNFNGFGGTGWVLLSGKKMENFKY